MEDQEKIEIKKVEAEVNICFEQLSKTKYKLICAKEQLRNAKIDMSMMEGKIKFMREVTIPGVQSKIKSMQLHHNELENELKKILED